MLLFLFEILQSFFILTFPCFFSTPHRLIALIMCYLWFLFSSFIYKLLCILSLFMTITGVTYFCPYSNTLSSSYLTIEDLPPIIIAIYALITLGFFFTAVWAVWKRKVGDPKKNRAPTPPKLPLPQPSSPRVAPPPATLPPPSPSPSPPPPPPPTPTPPQRPPSSPLIIIQIPTHPSNVQAGSNQPKKSMAGSKMTNPKQPQ